MATSIIPKRVQSHDQPTRNFNQDPELNKLVKSYELLLCTFLPDGSEAVCCVRDTFTGAIRQVLASKLLPYSFGKDAYLLELVSRGGDV